MTGTATTSTTLPRWNTDSLYPSLESAEFQAAMGAAVQSVRALGETFDTLNIRQGTPPADLVADFERALNEMNAVYAGLREVSVYIQAFVTTDSTNDLAQARASELGVKTVALAQLGTRFNAWVGGLDLDALLAGSQLARDHQYMLLRAQDSARHQMSEAEEELASQLNLPGSFSWYKLHSNFSSQMLVEFGGERRPMTAVRNLAGDPDPAVREAAYRAELAAWQAAEVPMAAALNGVKGSAQVLNARRGWPDSVAPTLLANSIDRATLEAMQAACVASFPDFRRYFRAKARRLGHERLPWWDLMAPVGRSSRTWTYAEATSFIVEQFGSYSPQLAAFADRAFREDWLDVPPRPGKRGGAFCMGWKPGESRILLNYDQNLDSVSTLAHELGHGYHNQCLQHRTPMQRATPMTLAETASIFCETIAVNAALRDASGDERLYILETQLMGQAQVVVDIHSRFLFEQSVFERRAQRDLSAAEFNELMLEAQRQTYGDGLTGDLHPYMWAVKGHYYSSSYYNYPYTFGLLFGLGLYAEYQARPEGFQARYDELLASTGLADAATLAAGFGIDTHDVAFWTRSLDVIRASIGEYEALATQV